MTKREFRTTTIPLATTDALTPKQRTKLEKILTRLSNYLENDPKFGPAWREAKAAAQKPEPIPTLSKWELRELRHRIGARKLQEKILSRYEE